MPLTLGELGGASQQLSVFVRYSLRVQPVTKKSATCASAATSSSLVAMAHPPPARLSELCDSWEPDGPTLGKVVLQLKPGSATGYKGVNKVKKNVYQARRTVGGTLEHVWTASSPRECAYVLAAVVGGLVDSDQLGQMKKIREDGRRVSDLDRSANKFLANVAQLECMWRQQPPSARAAREKKARS